jgi:uncharacterized protein (DUF1499 family)
MITRICLLALVSTLAACTSPPEYLSGSGGLPPCGSLPNCVNSDSGTGSQAVEPLAATDVQWRALKQWIADQDDWTVVEDRDDFLQCVAVTPMMRFRDDVQLLHRPELGLIHVRSSSRLGISDMGANRNRVELLRDQLEVAGKPRDE